MKTEVRILAVEDEKAVAQFLALLLGGAHCKVLTACDGLDALGKISAATQPFDIVITDHKMPRRTGLELVTELRARHFGGKIAVLSAHLDAPTARAYQELHVDLMLSKPFDIDELRHAVDVLAQEAPALAGRSAA
jgi:DNA-binding response OmpR family regulator